MSGNVWEWCWDSTLINIYNRHFRGGSYRDHGGDCMVSGGDYSSASYRYSSLGFRIVCNAD